jgi:hypothetical protein
MRRKKVSPLLTKGRGLNRRPLPLDPIPAQTGLAIQNDFAELDKHNSLKIGNPVIVLADADYRIAAIRQQMFLCFCQP